MVKMTKKATKIKVKEPAPEAALQTPTTFESPESSHVERGIYNPDGRYLIVIYRNKNGGQAYLYLDVPPETWAAFRAAESKGKFVNVHIIGGKFATFRKIQDNPDGQ